MRPMSSASLMTFPMCRGVYTSVAPLPSGIASHGRVGLPPLWLLRARRKIALRTPDGVRGRIPWGLRYRRFAPRGGAEDAPWDRAPSSDGAAELPKRQAG